MDSPEVLEWVWALQVGHGLKVPGQDSQEEDRAPLTPLTVHGRGGALSSHPLADVVRAPHSTWALGVAEPSLHARCFLGPHFTDGETEGECKRISCPRPCIWGEAEPEFEPHPKPSAVCSQPQCHYGAHIWWPIMAPINNKAPPRDFPGGPVLGTPPFHSRGRGFDLWSRN